MIYEIHEYAEIFPQMTPDEWETFLADVEENGVRVPVVLYQGKILDGRHRQEACETLNRSKGLSLAFDTIEFVGDDTQAVSFVYSANFFRRHLETGQKSAIGLRIKDKLQEILAQGQRTDLTCTNICTSQTQDPMASRAVTKAAEMAGVSRETIRKAEVIREKAPDIFESMAAGEVSLENALRATMKREAEAKHAEMLSVPPPTGQYRCIVIDPPWPMQKIERDNHPYQPDILDYPTMTLEEIAALPVDCLAHDDGCHVYLWVTQKYLPEGLRLFDKWGIKYQCLLTWVKPSGFTPYSWMYNTEHILFGRVGNLPLEQLGLKLSFDAPVTRHSEKPGVFFDRVLAASPEPRLEMFSRKERDGFTVWGNEVAEGSREGL